MDTPHHIIFVLHRLPLHIILNYFQNINKILRNFLWGHGTSITEIGTASSQKWSIYSLPNGISIHKEEEHLPYQPTQTVYSGWDTGGLRGSWTISGGWGGGSPHEWGGGDVLSVRTFFHAHAAATWHPSHVGLTDCLHGLNRNLFLSVAMVRRLFCQLHADVIN